MIGPTTYSAQATPAAAHDCRDCRHYRATSIFELCMRTEAAYKVAEKVDQHSIFHMRHMPLCGEDGKLFEPAGLTSADYMGN